MIINSKELLPLIAALTEKYTSRESTSVPYETAQMLMGAVIYCIKECKSTGDNELATDAGSSNLRKLYLQGEKIVLQKVYESKNIFDKMTKSFEDYGCCNYRETLQDGISAFFMRYDARFNPQDHLLTLDYPPLNPLVGFTGVDLILEYLKSIERESVFLKLFPAATVKGLLRQISSDYQKNYFENLCYPVLLHAIGCMITDQPPGQLSLRIEDIRYIQMYFEGDSKDKITQKLSVILKNILSQTNMISDQNYFSTVLPEYSARIWQALRSESLPNVFFS